VNSERYHNLLAHFVIGYKKPGHGIIIYPDDPLFLCLSGTGILKQACNLIQNIISPQIRLIIKL
jgi:hypothetical protein